LFFSALRKICIRTISLAVNRTVCLVVTLWAALLLSGPVNAANLGGDCCADLEERVAELEATAVRKGNRKVSLKLSGHVNRMLLYWDDTVNTDIYSVDNDDSESRFRLQGTADITPDLSAGFLIVIGVVSAESSLTDARIDGNPNENADGLLRTRKASFNLTHERLGKIRVGRDSPATDNILQLNIAKNPIADTDIDWANDFHLVRPHGTLGCNGAACRTTFNLDIVTASQDTPRSDIVRYDTPSLRGLVLSAAWGEDDLADIAFRYKKEWNSIRLIAGAGYLWFTDEREVRPSALIDCPPPGLGQLTCIEERVDLERAAGSIAAMHTPTGLYVFAGAAQDYFGVNTLRASIFTAPVTGRQPPTAAMWYLQGGIKNRFLVPSIGPTTLYGEYQKWDDFGVRRSSNSLGTDLTGGEIIDTSADFWGFGMVQDIDAAAMKLYAALRYWESEIQVALPDEDPAGQDVPIEDFLTIAVGGRIYF